MKTLLAGLFGLGALVVGVAPSGGASNGFRPAGVVFHSRGDARAVRTALNPRPTQAFGCGAISCAAYQAGVNGYFQDVAADSGTSNNVYSVATEYSDTTGNIAYDSTFGGTYVDTNGFPASGCPTGAASKCLTESQLLTEIQTDLSTNGWTANGTNLFFILLPAGVDTCFNGNPDFVCASNAFCAYHDSWGSLIFAVEPFNTSFSCAAAGQGFPNGQEIDETVNTASHEQNEAITDPYPDGGWLSSKGYENGDLCAWWFGADLGTTPGGQPYNQVINGHEYSLQQEWSNAANAGAGGCLQHLGGTATTVSPFVNDTGPLAYRGGSVMRTNTVYTIYWIPTPPAISIAPTLSGTPAVGKKLTTTKGTWANSPTGYLYKWQRCDNAGANCVDIPNATKASYTLVSADAGHEIRSEVLASNSAGSAGAGYMPSLPTAVVVAKPAVISKPVVSGTATVGMQLSVDTGSWTYSPTSYAYKWLRCSKSGGSCMAITGAKTLTYTLKKGDVGHSLKANVTAKNAAGSAAATSAKSGVVTK